MLWPEKTLFQEAKLDELRMERRKVEEISTVLSVIESLVETKNLDGTSYKT